MDEPVPAESGARCNHWLPDEVSGFGDTQCSRPLGHASNPRRKDHYFGPVSWNDEAGEYRLTPPGTGNPS